MNKVMKPSEWLDKAKKKENIQSDYRLAKIIGIEPASISTMRRRDNGMDNYTAIRIAEILEINKLIVIIDMEMKKAKSEEKKEFWKKKEEVYR